VERVFIFRKLTNGVEVDVGPNLHNVAVTCDKDTLVCLVAPEEDSSGRRTLSLSDGDITGLDQELDYHRSPMPRICTTWDQFELVVRDHGRELGKERFVDWSCSTPPASTQATTLWAISERAGRGKPANRGLQSDGVSPR
jgi:hypothetical protein